LALKLVAITNWEFFFTFAGHDVGYLEFRRKKPVIIHEKTLFCQLDAMAPQGLFFTAANLLESSIPVERDQYDRRKQSKNQNGSKQSQVNGE
jgi:hypothetical protein